MKFKILYCAVLPGLTAVLVLAAADVHAQTPADFSGLPTSHPYIYVVNDSGSETAGRLLRFDAGSLTLAASGGEVSYERAHVVTVARRGDSLRNGALVGALTGAVLGGLISATKVCGSLPVTSRRCRAGESVRIVLPLAGMGAAIGVGIDALRRGRTILYSTRTQNPTRD